jgi:uncharacterized membrane protein YkgB
LTCKQWMGLDGQLCAVQTHISTTGFMFAMHRTWSSAAQAV